ncbi:hypothetical protein NC653_034190 [Populus alba x Populus x berolinensis]|uniref:Uncharacterized protein n=1 Tax=Populus alba x Populus x berolinensis TaxID=444605 RepID=A0AAD6PVR6_9ROSI|nr:hypothetical protein NC653_034190 [Populus alba x Populus x berolinensis]
MIVVVVILRILLFDHAPNIAKLLNMTRNSDGALLMKPKLFLGFFQQVHEEWMIYINHRNHKPLLLLALTYHDSKTPFRDIFQLFLPLVVVVVAWQVNMEIQMEFIPTPHFSTTQKTKEKMKETAKETSEPKLAFFSCSCTLNSWILATRKRERKAKGQRQKWQA